MYFEKFQRVYYDFPIAANDRQSTLINVTDITRNIRFKTDFVKNISLFETYKMRDNETIEVVSEKIYGTPDYHWVLMLLNERYDYIEDFVLDAQRFEKYMSRKYGNRQNDIKFFINSAGVITNAKTILVLDNTPIDDQTFIADVLRPGLIIRRKTSIGDYSARVESIDDNGVHVMLLSGNIVTNDIVSIIEYVKDTDDVYKEQVLGSTRVISANLLPEYSVVSNYEYEYAKNEDKRMLKIIPPSYMAQIMTEFNELLK